MSASGYVHLECEEIVAETDKAFLCRLGEGEDQFEQWVPKSQIADGGDNLSKGDKSVTVSVTEWWAEKNGFEGGV
jgi:hypothetical protein